MHLNKLIISIFSFLFLLLGKHQTHEPDSVLMISRYLEISERPDKYRNEHFELSKRFRVSKYILRASHHDALLDNSFKTRISSR